MLWRGDEMAHAANSLQLRLTQTKLTMVSLPVLLTEDTLAKSGVLVEA